VNPRRITVVQNATDTRVVARQRAKLTPTDQVRLRSAIGLHPGPVGVVLGSLYPAKRVGFILSVADLVRKTMPDFQLVVIGDGPDRGIIESASRTRPWIHMLGAITGDAMVNAAVTGDIIIHPGALGLAVLDAFALELPLLTIDGPAHGPEIAYLEHGLNGWVLPGSTETGTYAAAVVRLLSDDHARAELRTGCRRAAQRYTVEAMADNFAAGIGAALQRRHKRIRNG
jgi:glycosyltransferase involved in cell wall biosynthesis